MITVQAMCPSCGVVELSVEDLWVRVCSGDDRGTYSFQCPGCGVSVVKPADRATVDVLASSGARMTVWNPPAELGEDRHGPPICQDDLIEFHQLLQSPGWFERLVQITRL